MVVYKAGGGSQFLVPRIGIIVMELLKMQFKFWGVRI